LPSNSSFVSVILVNYNGSAILEECLNALQQQTHNSFEVMVVDNGSTDDSVGLIRNNYPHIELITLGRNEGFARAHNIALEQALKKGPHAIALVNTDAVLDPDWLLSVMSFMENSGFDLIQSLVCMHEDPERIDSAGIGVTPSLKIYDRQHGQPVSSVEGHTEIFGPCFAAAAFRAGVFPALRDDHGYLDETFGSFYEDVDFCFRANAKGYKSALLAEPLCRHRLSYTADRRPFLKYFYLGRNYFLVLTKHIPSSTLLKNLPFIFLNRLGFCLRTISHPRNFCGFTLGSMAGFTRLTSRLISSRGRTKRGTGESTLIQKIKQGEYE
jgi:GT2 family glycosyltransferase